MSTQLYFIADAVMRQHIVVSMKTRQQREIRYDTEKPLSLYPPVQAEVYLRCGGRLDDPDSPIMTGGAEDDFPFKGQCEKCFAC